MLNKYPLWKYLMLIFIICAGFLYALPNLYGEDPALQISGLRGVQLEATDLDKVKGELDKAGLAYQSAGLVNNQVEVRFADTEEQLKAKEALNHAYGENYIIALNLTPATPQWLADLNANPMKLGLDLRGGVHFLMEVDMSVAIKKNQEETVSSFRTDLREEKIRYARIGEFGNGVKVEFKSEEDLTNAKRALKKKHGDLTFDDSTDEGFFLTALMGEQKVKEIKESSLQQNITIIRNRVNAIGVAEPVVMRQGSDRIVVELPGVQDTAQAKRILGATATLEFRMVDQNGDPYAAQSGRVPAGSELYYRRDNGQPVLLKRRVMLTGDHIIDAASSFDEYGSPQVNIDLDSKGGSIFSRATKDAIGKPMATLFIEYKPTGKRDKDGNPVFKKVADVISVATIQARLGSSFRITGAGSPQEAHDLALLLKAGALIAPIQIVEERTVGPSLGQENIDLGMQAIQWGFLGVLLFMVAWYKGFGMVANLALGLNLVLIVGVMSMIPGATLTLPGMAGIVLTVGMAVDANVLIFERIREELRDGRGPQQAIHHGYDSAFSTIADANITTFIAAVILYAVGTGPIKGFAVTLAIGIATSMFTAIVGTRAVINLAYGGRNVKKLSI
ncbi:protein translocase subunit SecD [Saccharobesus litoralis]|uniref:Protein translocase subunit SecD n=1 Tax=Saccharobesus litoralis TaxID=2172099 RepID=A0A2S0VMS5_9ALTE|nr:protein translocase subunit SecD [Saccharobesus litoralis]AWB65523.1 protein translocase subunit SecD [Saccharobesus litoralis]